MHLRTVLDVNVVDVQKRRNPSKHYMRILDKFPIDGGQKDPKKRIIPFLPGLDSSDPMLLEQYVVVANYEKQEPSEISLQAGEVVDVIEKSESVPKRHKAHLKRLDRRWTLGGVISRQQSREEKYVTVQSYSSQGKDEIAFEKGVIVEVIQKNLEGWWFISPQVAKKEISLPMPCAAESSPGNRSPVLRQKPPPRRDATLGFQLPSPPEAPTVEAEYYTIADFQSVISDGISFNGGQKADVIEKNSGGWWYVQIGEKEGWAPCSYIDKRKKPNLNRRTSTLCRPKVPPPAPPVKKQDSVEIAPPSSPGSEAPESPVSPSRPVYEEPEYDVPAIGDLDLESEFEFLRGEGSLVDTKMEDSFSEKGSQISSKPSPASSLHSASFKMGESFEDSQEAEAEKECIYENDGFWPFREAPERQCSRESNSSKTSVLSDSGKTASNQTPSPGGWRSAGSKLKIDLNGSSFAKSEDTPSPKSASTEFPPKKDKEENKESLSTKGSAKLKPVVRPKPQMAKSPSAEKMDISTLRKQLRPTGQLKNGNKTTKGEDSETASVVSSEDSFSSQSTSDLSSNYSKGSRGDSDLEGCMQYRTTDPYEKVQESELSFPAGVEVEVLEKQESGWWYIRWGDNEGWAPTYYLEPIRQQDEMVGSESDGSPTKSLSKSNSLEKNEQRVQALNNINQNLKKVTPPIPSKPPGGFTKPLGLFGTSKKQNSTKQQQVVRPQSVFISAPIMDGPSPVSSLRRNESLNSTDHPRASPTVRRNASFGTVPRNLTPNNITLPSRYRSGNGSSESLSHSSVKNAVPVSTVKPKPHIIHNNLRDVYVSIADYHGDEETMGFPEGTSLEVLERNPNGWWYCKVLDNGRPRKGWVPSNYLEKKH
ncbi:hypothetical protein WMY93_018210 [Mugilogobius chulae]|uniref:SH3 domain-containing protein n=1 Tax=Mugilogobius chulae TaxID=88201 RepID=A0AAW0NUZ3_9GOBI